MGYSGLGFPHSSAGKESACNAGDPTSIPALGRSAGEGRGFPRGSAGKGSACWLMMLRQFQMNSEGTQPYIYMHPFFPKPHCYPGWHIALSRVPCAVQDVLVGYPFWIQQCVQDLPKLPNYPLPLATISSFSKSVSLFLFYNKFICIISF